MWNIRLVQYFTRLTLFHESSNLLAMNNSKPEFLKHLFWEFDFEQIDVVRNKFAIIERVINYGDFRELSWLFKTYDQNEIVENLKSNYNISTKAVNIWAEVFGFDKTECKCMSRPLALRVFDF